jgi:hypothetical protein
VIYLGWEIVRSLPNGRLPSTIEQETVIDQQMTVLSWITAELARLTTRANIPVSPDDSAP